MERLKSGIWVSAHIRLCQGHGAFATVVRRGDHDAGAIFVVVRCGAAYQDNPEPVKQTDSIFDTYAERISLYFREYDEHDVMIWRAAYDDLQPEQIINERLAREVSRDSDLWILEIEACDGQGFLSPIAA